MGMIDSSRSALLAFQRVLQTTSHNIANVNTEGYSRQSVTLENRSVVNPDTFYPGAGVKLGSLNRAYDQILIDSARHDSATFGQTETFYNMTADIDRLFANSDTGLASQVQAYFSAVQNVSNDPSSVVTRQVLLGETDMLTARFNELANKLDDYNNTADARIAEAVSDINNYTQQIAEVNARIMESGQHVANDLLDTRDLLINKLSEKVSVNTITLGDGSVSVFAADGQPLVTDKISYTMSVHQSEYVGDGFRIIVGNAGIGPDVTDRLSGGVIGGILEYQNTILRPAQNEIGRMAAVLADNFNELHREGYDLDGNTGNDFFTLAEPNVYASSENTSPATVTASFIATVDDAYDINGDTFIDAADIAQLKGNWQASDYELEDTGATWSLTRLSDNANIALTANVNGTLTAADGFVINVDPDATLGVQNDGDRFLVRPFQYAASALEKTIDDPRSFAAANSFDPSYEAEYLGGTDWKITRSSDGFSTTVTDDGNGILDGLVDGFDEGFELTLPVAPTIGDKFEVHPFDSATSELTTTVIDKAMIIERNVLNTSGWNTYSGGIRVGNNENALALADLQTDKLIGSGTRTISDAYNQLISTVGIKTNQSNVAMKAQGIMLEHSKGARDSVAGVNLDEEAADLIRYQQAYQAAAKVMAAADQMFKTLINSF